MHVDAFKAAVMKGRGHFDLTVDALLTQNGHARSAALMDKRRGDIFIRFEIEFDLNTRVLPIQQCIELLLCTARVVTQGLHAKTGFAPGTLQIDA